MLVVGVYGLLIAIVLVMWIWSIYLQRELTLNSITIKVGDTFSWVLVTLFVLGAMLIGVSNFTPVQVWKVFIFLVLVLGIDVVILWMTATWVQGVASHKIEPAYHVKHSKRENSYLGLAIWVAIGVLVGVLISGIEIVAIGMFVCLPIILVLERAVSLKIHTKEVSKFPTYTKEEVEESEKRLRLAVERGEILKPKENALKKLVRKEKIRVEKKRVDDKIDTDSAKMVDIKRKNDELAETKNSDKEEDDKE